MRRKRLGGLIALSFFSWVLVSYLLFFYCPNCEKDDKLKQSEDMEEESGLQNFEQNVQDMAKRYNKLFQQLKKTLMKKKSSILVSKLKQNNSNKDNTQNNSRQSIAELQQINKTTQLRKPARNDYSIGKNITDYNNITTFDMRMRSIAKGELEDGGPVIAVLVFSCNRVTVRRCLDQLLKYRPSKEQFPIIVSQDCYHQPTTEVILSYGDQITLIQQPDQSEIPVPPKEKKFKGYFKIARHYGWALNQTFFNFKFDTAIVVEDDLDIAPDFFEYFLGTYWLLRRDPTLWCVSAWNDNGKNGLVDESQPEALYRTDFFPGLGWMLTSALWTELSRKWPKSYWDDWIRKPEQRRDRACIRPELPRTKTFGKIGVSNGMFFEKHLKYMKLNEKFVSFTKLNLSYLLKDNYDGLFVKEVYSSPVVSYQELKSGRIVSPGSVRIPYYTRDQYKNTAKFLGLMDDFKSGVPRTAYRGVVTFSYKGRRAYLAPHFNWKAYDITWS